LLKRIVSFSQRIDQSPNINPNDSICLQAKAVKNTTKAVKSTTAKFAPTT